MTHDEDDSPLTQLLRAELPKLRAPDALEARIRASIAEAPARAHRPRLPLLAAAAVVIAVASSALTYLGVERSHRVPGDESVLVAAHVRSLPPGRLMDVVSTDQHNVKPWFNGRVDVSPTVVRLDSLGFTLAGGRIDSVDGHTAAVVVYRRRQHVVNVFSWSTDDASASAPHEDTVRGFHIIAWRSRGMEQRAVSDLNSGELAELVRALRGSD
jgi:anti-sigma factor RsiW